MTVHVYPTAAAAAKVAALTIARHLDAHPTAVLGLPTGHTAAAIYEHLARLHADGDVSFAQVRSVNLDEFRGLGARDPRSFRAFMHRHLFTRVRMPRVHAYFLNGIARDPEHECRRYERLIARLGGIDLQLLGLGVNGHIGFNEPAAALRARTHSARLTQSTRRANADRFDGRTSLVPTHALTMGMATIFGARSIVLVALGRAKTRAVRAAIEGPITTACPASLLQLHPRIEVILDEAAAGLLTKRQHGAE